MHNALARSSEISGSSAPALKLASAAEWITAEEAAERSGLSLRRVQELCETRWRFGGAALTETPPGGGKPVWMIDPRADARLMPQTKAEQGVSEALLALTAEQRKTLQDDLAYMLRADEAGRAAVRAYRGRCKGIQEFLKREPRAGWSWSQFQDTYKAWRQSDKKIEALIDGRWITKKKPANDARMLEEAVRFYLGTRKSIAACIRAAEQMAIEKGWRVYGESAVRHRIAKIPAAEVAFKRVGTDEFRNRFQPTIERSYADLKSNEIWQSDHYHMDVICQVGEKMDRATGELVPQYARPWLTLWIDVRSRKILAFIIRAADPDSGVILACLYRAIVEFGAPEWVYIDNGRDYTCQDFYGETKAARHARENSTDEAAPNAGIYAALKIGIKNATEYNARAKLQERLHLTIKEQFCKDWPTYTGGNPQEKPEELPEAVAKGKAPELADFIAAFGSQVELYDNTIHQGKDMGCTPNEAYAQNLERKRTAPRELLDVLMLRRVGPVKVGRNGVRYHGLNFGQYDTGHLQGQEVFLRVDDADMSKVSVWSLDDKFLTFARANRQLPALANRELLRAAIREQQRYSRQLKGAHEARMRIHEDLPDTMFRLEQERAARLARNRPQTPTPTPTIVPVRSPIEGELNRYQRALEATKPPTAEEAAQLRQAHKGIMEAINAQYEERERQREQEELAVPSILDLVAAYDSNDARRQARREEYLDGLRKMEMEGAA